MSVKDFIKSSVLDNLTNNTFSGKEILISLMAAFVIGLYIYFVYRIVTKKGFYSKSFNISLVLMAILTAAVIITIQSSIVVSLGMVGALSIVRFRTAIKDPMDLIFLFWAITGGIICGTGLYSLAIITSLVVTATIVVLELIPCSKQNLLLIVNMSNVENEKILLETVKQNTSYNKVKSRNLRGESIDMIIEIKTKDETELIKKVKEVQGTTNISLVSHNNEITY